MSPNKKPPCYGCVDRHIGCHSECDKYKQWKEIRDAKMAEIKKKERLERALVNTEIEANMRRKRAKGRSRRR